VPGPIIPNVNAGQHQLDVVDANTCSFSSQLTIPYLPPSPPQIQQIITTPDFGSQDGTAIAVVSGGTPPFLYDWGVLGLGQNNDTIIGLSAGFDSLGLVDANGCSDFMTYTIPYATGVYPGDADHSQQVDMNDLLPIGIHFGRTGPPRPNASLQWQPQLAPPLGRHPQQRQGPPPYRHRRRRQHQPGRHPGRTAQLWPNPQQPKGRSQCRGPPPLFHAHHQPFPRRHPDRPPSPWAP
jgi:hypothetical protein